MRHCGPSKQRVWLGSGRYSCCGGRRDANTDAHCYSDGDRHANCQSHCYSNCNCNGHAATNANTAIGTITQAASHASSQALELSVRSI